MSNLPNGTMRSILNRRLLGALIALKPPIQLWAHATCADCSLPPTGIETPLAIPVVLGRFLTQVAGSVEQLRQLINLVSTNFSIDKVIRILWPMNQPPNLIS